MFQRQELDAVAVATPETGHREPAEMAAKHGCAVLVEKPIAASLTDADAMITGCEIAGVALIFGYMLRNEIDHFLTCVQSRAAPLVDGQAGRKSLEIGIAADRSIKLGRDVELPLR